MILPIVAYGDPVLKKMAQEIDQDYPELSTLIANMYETMYNAYGVGLAAPQIGLSIRLFIVDASPFADDTELTEEEQQFLANFKKTFINPKILKEEGDEWVFNEGCLSIPDIREDVFRKPKVTLQYFDENFQEKTEVFEGLAARVIQHEYDHIEGILFTDRLSMLKKRLIKGRLQNISTGKIKVDYRMKFPKQKKKR
ncbi:MAG: peptide deformylase [Flavobacteriaceae bacterium]|nr:peptide deformylase [Mangrovimonas sp.]MCB0438280.1 peptide deformylase [Mangrovimonas sp.]HPF96678.1 peptide deformylase [Mangrovimonas sp.]HRV54221.1 peptide deformylase [Mangrovimonas sp.]